VRPFERFSLLLWGLVLLAVLAQLGYLFHFWGFRPFWDLIHLAGHAAGWCGAALMGLSLLFIPRKKKWFTRGSIKFWYRLHVFFGLTGPLLLVLHAYGKYHGFGGLTFLCMWVVLMTGIIGHYLYRRLPEEVEVRSRERRKLLESLAEVEAKIAAFGVQLEDLKDELTRAGPLSRLSTEPPQSTTIDSTTPESTRIASTKLKLPRPALLTDIKSIIPLWREFRSTGSRVRELGGRVRRQAASERRAVALREQELIELLHLERDTRMLVTLNELFSIWRKVHVPLSWLMWWMAGLHLFAWVYY
jgi:hypothetical protein